MGVWCAAPDLRQAAHGGGEHYQLSFASWLLRIISSSSEEHITNERLSGLMHYYRSCLTGQDGRREEGEKKSERVRGAVSLVSAQPKKN